MAQQINLYGASFRRPQLVLSASNAWRGVMVVLTLCLLVGGFLTWRSSEGGMNPAEQGSLTQRQTQVAALKEQVAAQRQDVETEAAKLREVEQALARVKATLQGGAAGESTISYAAYFQALAHQTHGSLWLTGFAISPDGQSMELKGRMLDASALPDYLSRLNAEPIFKGRQFAQLQLNALASDGSDTAPRVTEFVLRTTPVQDMKEPAR